MHISRHAGRHTDQRAFSRCRVESTRHAYAWRERGNAYIAALCIVVFGVALFGLAVWLEYRRDPDEIWLGGFLLLIAVVAIAVRVWLGRRP